MAGLGRKDFQAGAVLSAADVDGYLMDQTVMKFANTAAAGSAYGTAIAEGMNFYLSDTDEVVFHNGTSFVKQAAGENLVANGDFSKWARGTSVTNPATFTYLADNWMTTANGSVSSVASRQSFTPGSAPVAGYENPYFLRWAISAASGSSIVVFHQRINDVRTLAGQTITVSFWAKYDSTRTMTISARQDFGTGGSTDVSTSFASQTVTSSWARYTASIALPSIAGKTIGTNSYLELNLGLPINTVLTADIWGVQLEAGAVATAFKPAGGNSATDTVTSGSAGFDGVLVSTNSSTNPSGSGTPAWAGYDVAGKNKVINGAMDYWQRGTSYAAMPGGAFLADRWSHYQDGTGNVTVSQQAFTPGTAPVAGYEGQYYIRSAVTTTGTATYMGPVNKIEDVRNFANQTVTMSFWAKADSARAAYFYAIQGFGSGGSGSVLAMLTNITLSTSWTRYSYSFTMPSIAGKTLGAGSHIEVGVRATHGSGAVLDVWGVQVEAGSVATPFSRAAGTLQGELAACQRYYFRSAPGTTYGVHSLAQAWSSTAAGVYLKLPVSMRIVPTSVESSTASGLCLYDGTSRTALNGTPTIDGTFCTPDIAYVNAPVASGLTATRSYAFQNNATAGAYIAFSAEL